MNLTGCFRSRLSLSLIAAVLCVGLPVGATDQPQKASDPTFEAFKIRAFNERGEKRSKLDLSLDFLRNHVPQSHDDVRGRATKAIAIQNLSVAPWARSLERHSGLRMIGSSVIVEAVVDHPEKAAEELTALGMTRVAVAGGLVSGVLPAAHLERAAQISGLRFLRPASRALTRVGSTTSGGDAALGSDIARQSFGVDGSGVRIGVLSNSFDYLNARFGFDGATRAGIESGNLPGPGNPNGFTTPVVILEDFPEASGLKSDEGRAMAEIIHDIAPGAEIGFATGIAGQATLAENIRRLADPAGFDADILVDDIGFSDAPFFQDGVVAQAVDEVVAAGKVYFTSAGNHGSQSYESDFRPSPAPILARDGEFGPSGEWFFHDFDPGPGVDYLHEVTIDAFSELNLWLQWDDPFASNCAGCPGAESNLDLLVFSAESFDSLSVGLSSFEDNIGRDAVEAVAGSTGDGSVTLYLAIGKWALGPNPDPGKIKWIDFGSASTTFEWDTQSSTIAGHSNAEGAVAVGAALYTTAGPGLTPLIEDFSSRGGTEILFAVDGSPTSDFRLKPEVVGPDGGNTSFFPGGENVEQDNFPNFFGTSAAAPHVAAVAALIREASGFDLSPDFIRTILEVTAIDMDDPATPDFDQGFDHLTGAGFVDAEAAVGLVAFPW